jgi:cephalosporin-C deacetylase-like acetyl esterase
LFVKDYYSRCYGWYVMDRGRFIHHEINAALTDFQEKRGYDRVVTFGSSKGGTAAVVYGMMNAHITHTFALVPPNRASQVLAEVFARLHRPHPGRRRPSCDRARAE